MSAKPVSRVRQAIAEISRDACATALRPHGFRRASPHFWRAPAGGLYQCINFQGSQFGSQEKGEFTINVGVTSPALSVAFTQRPFPKTCSPNWWPISARIGRLMPEDYDVWWKVDHNTDIAALGAEISHAVVSHALPFLEHFGTGEIFDDDLLNRYKGLRINLFPGPLALVRAALAAQHGDLEKAAALLRGQLKGEGFEGFKANVRRLATELAIKLDAVPGT